MYSLMRRNTRKQGLTKCYGLVILHQLLVCPLLLLPSSFVVCLLTPEEDKILSKALVRCCFLVFRCIGEYISLDLFYHFSFNGKTSDPFMAKAAPPPFNKMLRFGYFTSAPCLSSSFNKMLRFGYFTSAPCLSSSFASFFCCCLSSYTRRI